MISVSSNRLTPMQLINTPVISCTMLIITGAGNMGRILFIAMYILYIGDKYFINDPMIIKL